tara:strand:+ start:631 stop:951 length:321 start_codon:yes stop_codon:yes gene_type:complete
MELLYYTWEIFTMDEKNAWWLMMVVFSVTCITFIYTNVKIRLSQEIQSKKIKNMEYKISYLFEKTKRKDISNSQLHMLISDKFKELHKAQASKPAAKPAAKLEKSK